MKPKPFRFFTTNMKPHLHISFFFHLLLSTTLSSSTEFISNGFNTSDLLLFGNATIDPPPDNILTLTNNTPYAVGRALYNSKIRTRLQNSSSVHRFYTSFIFAMAPYRNVLPGHGLVFIFTPSLGIDGTDNGQYLGFVNRTLNRRASNHLFGVEFDVFKNEDYQDIDDNHVGININSLTSTVSRTAGYWVDRENGDNQSEFKKLDLNDGRNYQVWIDYEEFVVNVTMAPIGMTRPRRPLLSESLNLSSVFEEEMYVGFTAATAALVQSHKILAWSFSNSNFSLSSSLITTGLPSFILPDGSVFRSKGFIGGVSAGFLIMVMLVALFVLFLIRRKKLRHMERESFEEWELEYWPHRIVYQEIEAATKGFSDENVIGIGANGKVCRGVLPGGVEIAVKRILCEDDDGMRAFLAEVSSLGRLKHRNLVGLRGWCKREKGSFLLVYDYMENGSLDTRVFECDESKMLNCEDRIRILKDVASGVLYLHEGWEAKVLHRDIKASNVLLDKEMNGRLGDFGLARMHDHGTIATTTRVVGTVGYLAPEVIRTGRASVQTDVFGFGILILEVMCGRRPIEEGKPGLVDWVWQVMGEGELINALDERLRVKGEFDPQEVVRVLHLGLLCAYPDPSARPNMRQVVKVLEGNKEAIDSETEDMGTYLLERTMSGDVWNNNPRNFGYGGSHPTFEDIRQSLSSSMPISWSNSIMEGR